MSWLRSLLSEGTPDSLMRTMAAFLVVNGVIIVYLGYFIQKDTLMAGSALIGLGIGGKLGQKPFENKQPPPTV